VKLLPAAQKKPTVYGVPLVSWAPIAGAGAYEVEWSKTSYPFKLEANNPSVVTYATSLLLGPRRGDGSVGPLSPGVWYYRVRGIDFSIAAGSSPASRRLSWSDPIPILVAKPTFKIVGGGTSVTVGKSSGSSASSFHRWNLTDFALTLPKAWKQLSVKDTVISFAAYDPALKGGYRTSVSVLAAGGRDTRTVAQWEQDLVAQAKRLTTGTIVHAVVTEPGGTAVYLEYHVPSGKKTIAVQQYVFDAGAKSYIVTFETLAGLEKGYSATFAAAARSFRLG
jgi:hypothetical protein